MTVTVCSVDQAGYQDPLFWFMYFRTNRDLFIMGWQLDLMILEVFSNL